MSGRRLPFRVLIGLALAASTILAGPALAAAQESEDPADSAWFRIGPVHLTPSLSIRDVGVDNNVFNDSDDPVKDFSATINPEVRGGMRLGPARITAGTSVGFVYYSRYKNQESVNTLHEAEIEVPLNRLRPFAGFELVRTRARPGFEIDARARRSEPAFRGGAEIRVSGTTSVRITARRTRTEFDEGELFLGRDLAETLNRQTNSAAASLHFSLTPLTSLVIASEAERTRFDANPARDSNGLRLSSGFEFAPDALLHGSAFVGYRSLDGIGGGLPPFSGISTAVGLGYVFRGSMRIDGRFDRDVGYSFEDVAPYYLATGGSITVTQQVVGPVDVTGTLTRQSLKYRALDPASSANRVDVVHTLAGGGGYRVGESTRVGLNVEYTERTSNTVLRRAYDRLRIFATLTVDPK